MDFSNTNSIDISQYIIIKRYTETSLAIFYTVIHKETGEKYIAKVYKKQDKSDDDINKSGDCTRSTVMKIFKNEKDILSQLDSPFIIKLIGFSLTDFNTDSRPTLIMENAPNGTLGNFLRSSYSKTKEWNETRKLMVIYGIASGILHIHSKGLSHCYLEPDNIFLNDYLMPKIANFELSIIGIEISITSGMTINYIAPEILKEEDYDKSVDAYSFGLIMHEIISGKFLKMPIRDKLNGIKPKLDPNIPKAYADLINRCLEYDPKKRPNFEEIVSLLKTSNDFITEKFDKKFDKISFSDSDEIGCPLNKPDESIGNNANKDMPCSDSDNDISDDSINKPDEDKKEEGKIEKTKFEFEEIHIEYPQTKELLINVDPIDLELFTREVFIGRGQFGKVYRIKNNKTKKIYAAKTSKLNLESCNDVQIINLSREINILSKVQYPSIMKFIGYNPKSFKNKPKPTIITEFIKNNSLEDILKFQSQGLTLKGWNETKALINIYGIASGMAYLHSQNIIHRDLKPGNIFIDDYLYPKIGDFGLSKEIDDQSTSYYDSKNYIGTPAFMAPEIFDEYKYSKEGDVYAFGLTIYRMITLEEPFKGLDYFKLIIAVATGLRPKIESYVPIFYRQLIEKCWSNEADKRPTFNDIVDLLENSDEFITKNIDKEEYLNYIQYIKDKKIKKSFYPVTIDFKELKKLQQKNISLNVSYLDLKQYEKLNLIKKISNFKIYDIKNKENEIIYEAKISNYSITDLSKNEIIHLSREINILSKLNHQSFLKFIGYSPIDFNQQPMPVIVTEKPPNRSLKDLLKYERDEGHIEEWDDTKKLIVIYGISAGMSYLHSNNILHRNLTPDSIFLDKYLFPKIGNFGLLERIHSIKTMTYQTTIGIKGDITYSSPELLECNEYSKSSDVYAFSLIVYEIMTNEKPFKKIKNLKDLKNEIVINGSRPQFNDKIKEHYQKLISCCWSQNPQDRPTFSDIMSVLKNDLDFLKDINKEIFNKYVEFIEKSNSDFYSKNQVVNFNDLIEKRKIENQTNYNNKENNIDDEDYDNDDESKEKIDLTPSGENKRNKIENEEEESINSILSENNDRKRQILNKRHEKYSDTLSLKKKQNKIIEEDSDSLSIKKKQNKIIEEDSDSLSIKKKQNKIIEEDSDSLSIKKKENKIIEEDSNSLSIKKKENKIIEEDSDSLLIKEEENKDNEKDSNNKISYKRKSGKFQDLSKKHHKKNCKKEEFKSSLIENDSKIKKIQENKSKIQNQNKEQEFEENGNLIKIKKKKERKKSNKKIANNNSIKNISNSGSTNKIKSPNNESMPKHKNTRHIEYNKNNSDDDNAKKYKPVKKKAVEPKIKNQNDNEPIIDKHRKRKSSASKIKEKITEYSDNEDNYKKSETRTIKKQQETSKLYSTKLKKGSFENKKINEYEYNKNNRNEELIRKDTKKKKQINRSKSVDYSRSINDKMSDKFDLSYSEESSTMTDSIDNLYQNNHEIATKRNHYEFSMNNQNQKSIGKNFKIKPMESLFYNSESLEEDDNEYEVEEESSSDNQLDLISRKKKINWNYIIDPLQPKLSKQQLKKMEEQLSIDKLFNKIVSTKK